MQNLGLISQKLWICIYFVYYHTRNGLKISKFTRRKHNFVIEFSVNFDSLFVFLCLCSEFQFENISWVSLKCLRILGGFGLKTFYRHFDVFFAFFFFSLSIFIYFIYLEFETSIRKVNFHSKSVLFWQPWIAMPYSNNLFPKKLRLFQT